MRIAFVGLLGIAMVMGARGQLVRVGPPDPHYCDGERVQPNLTVELDAEIHGRIVDATGEPFSKSPVELRVFLSPSKQAHLKTVTTDADGNFHFERIKAGKYRLIASPTRAFQQPFAMHCAKEKCDFAITLEVNPTDQSFSQCPVR